MTDRKYMAVRFIIGSGWELINAHDFDVARFYSSMYDVIRTARKFNVGVDIQRSVFVSEEIQGESGI